MSNDSLPRLEEYPESFQRMDARSIAKSGMKKRQKFQLKILSSQSRCGKGKMITWPACLK